MVISDEQQAFDTPFSVGRALNNKLEAAEIAYLTFANVAMDWDGTKERVHFRKSEKCNASQKA